MGGPGSGRKPLHGTKRVSFKDTLKKMGTGKPEEKISLSRIKRHRFHSSMK